MTRTLRADGEINRLRILAVARSAFAEHGIAVPVRDIARRADVAPATIYRHFPGRADLVHAVLSDHVADCETEMRRALEDSDPGRALRTTIQRFAQRQINERGLNDALFGPAGAAGPFTAQRRAHARLFEQLVDRARATGSLRPQVSVEDIRAGLVAIASISNLPTDKAKTVIARLVDLIIAGIEPRQEGLLPTNE